MGNIVVITGPMFAGKTTKLLSIYDELQIKGEKNILIKPKLDNRFSVDNVVTHDKKSSSAFSVNEIDEILSIIDKENPDNVFIDEIIFFKSDIVNFLINKSNKINFFVSGLNQTSEGKPFPFIDKQKNFGDLLVYADEIIILNAKCVVCGKSANRTFKKTNSGNEIEIGGIEKYEPRCNKHWIPKK